jgi:hypothetical protein
MGRTLRSTLRADCCHLLQVRGPLGDLAKAVVQCEVKATNAANDLMATVSPDYLMLRDAWMSAVTKEPKTFNNWLGFERGLW